MGELTTRVYFLDGSYEDRTVVFREQPDPCLVFWGSHGCTLEHGHKVKDGTEHECDAPDEDGTSCPPFNESWSAFGADVTPEEVAAAQARRIAGGMAD